MKIQKSLLVAIAVAVTVGTISCTKDKTLKKPDSKENKGNKTDNNGTQAIPVPCIACGMG